jgi:hypothetical protein
MRRSWGWGCRCLRSWFDCGGGVVAPWMKALALYRLFDTVCTELICGVSTSSPIQNHLMLVA